MDPKLATLSANLSDERGKRVVFASHCILNQNVRYLGGACRKGTVDELVDEFQRRGLGIFQMPCPEENAWGGVLKRKMWAAAGSRGTPKYRLRGVLFRLFLWRTRRIYSKIAMQVVKEIRDYLDSGFEVVGVVGVPGSPSCGVSTTLDLERSFEALASLDEGGLDRRTLNESVIGRSLVPGEGIFIQELRKQLTRLGVGVHVCDDGVVG